MTDVFAKESIKENSDVLSLSEEIKELRREWCKTKKKHKKHKGGKKRKGKRLKGKIKKLKRKIRKLEKNLEKMVWFLQAVSSGNYFKPYSPKKDDTYWLPDGRMSK